MFWGFFLFKYYLPLYQTHKLLKIFITLLIVYRYIDLLSYDGGNKEQEI